MRELLDTEQQLNSHEQALDEIYQRLMRGEKIVSYSVISTAPTLVLRAPQAGVPDVYEKGVQEKMDTYKAKTSRQKYAKSDNYTKFKQAIYVSQYIDSTPPYSSGYPFYRKCTIPTPRCRCSSILYLEVYRNF